LKKRINPTRDEGQNGDEFERILADLRGHTWAWLHVKGYDSWRRLAADANVSYQTIENLAYGKTKSPHLRTMVQVLSAMGKYEQIARAFSSGAPVSERKATQLVPQRKKTRSTKSQKK